jgi:outer membrane biosynthesis protein TonB
MLKTMLLIGAAAVSFPALAQNQPVDTTTPPAASEPVEPAAENTQPAPTPEAAQPAPTPDAAQPTPAPAPDATPPAATDPAAAQPAPPAGEATTTAQAAPSGTAATPTQVAQIVNTEFPTYDADSSAELSEVEFGTWMKKLRTASEPTVDVESAEVKTWIGQAYGAADADKNGTVSKEELTAFLSKGA